MDQKAFRAAAKCGHVTKEVAKEYGMGKKRLDKLTKEGYLKKEKIVDGNKNPVVYKLTSQGKNYTKNHVDGVKNLYKGASYNHDNKLLERFIKLSDKEQIIAQTEADIKHDYSYTQIVYSHPAIQAQETGNTNYYRYSPPDMYVPEHTNEQGQIVAASVIEIITNNYGVAEISAKQDFSEQILGTSNIEYIKT